MCWHKWSKWKDTRAGAQQIITHLAPVQKKEKAPIHTTGDWWIEQERRCEKCGMVQLRTAKA